MRRFVFFLGFLFLTSGGSFASHKSVGNGNRAGAEFGRGVLSGRSTNEISSKGNGFLGRGKSVSNLSSLNDTTLSGEGAKAARREEFLHMSEMAKLSAAQEHDISPDNDFFQASAEIEANPLGEIGGGYSTKKTKVKTTTKEFCQEGVEFEVDVVRQLVYEPNIDIKKERKYVNTSINTRMCHRNRCSGAAIQHTDKYVRGKGFRHDGIYKFSVVDEEHEERHWTCFDGCTHYWHHVTKNYKEIEKWFDAGGEEYWEVINPKNQTLVEGNQCYEINRVCLDSGTKTFSHGIKVKRSCWKEKRTFSCHTEPLDGCDYLKKKRCELVKSTCVDDSIEPCAKWRRQYLCESERELVSSSLKDSGIFCLDGKCYKPKIGTNNNLQEAASALAVFQEIQKDMDHGEPVTFFRGQANSCAIHLLNFTNCCSSMDGWGCSVGLSSCSSKEKSLALKKKKRLCHYVGTYCAEDFLGACLRKKSNYCCFGSKLARLFHEQGRAQLGRGWGEAEHPECGPFTAEELSQLDFSRMDFSEIFEDLFEGLEDKVKKQFEKNLGNQMPTAQKNIDIEAQKKFVKGGSNVTKTVF